MTTAPTAFSEGSTGPASKASFDLEPNPFEQSFASKESTVDSHKQPSLSGNGGQSSPQLLTPGGRKLPLPILSPNAHSGWNNFGAGRTGLTPNESGLRTGLTPNGSGPSMGSFPHSFQNLNIPGLNTPGGGLSAFASGFTPGLSSILSATAKEFEHLQQQQPPPSIHMNKDNLPLPVQAQTQTQTETQTQTQSQPHSQPQSQPQTQTQTQPQTQTETQAQNQEATKTDNKDTQNTTKSKPAKRSRKKKTDNESESKRLKTSPPVSSSSNADFNSSKTNPASTSMESAKSASGSEDKSGEDPHNEESEEDKRKSFLERNRVAASKCRQRKKQQIEKMETDLNFYLNEYNNLTHTIDQLKEQALLMRNFIMADSHEPQKRDVLVVNGINTILNTIEQTNYMARLRGNNPSNIIPTVQPINPNLVAQPQQQQQQQGVVPHMNQLTVQTNMAQMQQMPNIVPASVGQPIQFNPLATVSNSSLTSVTDQQANANSRDISSTPMVIVSSVPGVPTQIVPADVAGNLQGMVMATPANNGQVSIPGMKIEGSPINVLGHTRDSVANVGYI